jgi:hypothetical protein
MEDKRTDVDADGDLMLEREGSIDACQCNCLALRRIASQSHFLS